MLYWTNLENALEQQIQNGRQLSESLSALLSHASSQVEQYPSSLIRRAASTLAILNSISEECEEIKKILSPSSLLDKEYQLKTAFTSQPRLPSSVSLREHLTDLLEMTSHQSPTLSSGSPTSDTGASTNLPSPYLLRKKSGLQLAPGPGITSVKLVESPTSPTTVERIVKPLTKSVRKKSTTSSKPASQSSTGASSKKTPTT